MHNGRVKFNSLHAYYIIIKMSTRIDFDNEYRFKIFDKAFKTY